MTDYQKIDEEHYLPTYKRFPLTITHGKGSKVWDSEGKEYIDALAGIAVNSLGHSHPKVVEAIKAQAEKLIHISNFYLTEPQALLSEKLAELSGLPRVFFGNSGAEANEGAIKIARKYAHTHNRGGEIISFEGCFHGRTLATIATGKLSMQEGFEPIPEGFKTAPFNDIETLKSMISDQTAAVIIEPIQGEGGINVVDKDFMKQLRTLCDDNNIVLIFDEIQCGIGRTGYFFAKDYFGVQPDILTSAKALGSGVPISAIMTTEKISSVIKPGDHGTTFGGNALATAASLAAMKAIEEENLMGQATEKGQWFIDKIKENQPESIGIKGIRGMGLMLGFEFDRETKPIVEEMMNNGVLANATAETILRIVPPLNISYEDLEKVIEVMFKSAKKIRENA
ncbi:MAG: aspartate aminotransferase family protein [Bacteroidales bacterium]|nr:aspartate aminotransferase family protein [Bacteroidales bacterium]MCF8339225.1 aspartate aminotransferase family protein [Bacteroidales bacterium]